MATPTVYSTTMKTEVILREPEDWDEWIQIVNNKARGTGLIDFVKLDSREPAHLAKPARPQHYNVKIDATSLADLDTEQRNLYKMLRDDYHEDLRNYETQQDALRELRDHIQSTVARKHLTFVLDKETPHGMLTTLRDRLAPSDRAREVELAACYQQLKRIPTRSQQINEWLQNWEKVYKEAKAINLPEIQKERPLYDFLAAVKARDPGFAAYQEGSLTEKIQEKRSLPSLVNLLDMYRQHLRLTQPTSKAANHSAFGATYQGEQQEAKRDETWPQTPCLCGKIHRYRNCYYLIERIRPANWSPDPALEKKSQGKPVTCIWSVQSED